MTLSNSGFFPGIQQIRRVYKGVSNFRGGQYLYSLSEPTVQPATPDLSLIAQIKGQHSPSNGMRPSLRVARKKPEHRWDFCLMVETHLADFIIPRVLTSSDKWTSGRPLPRSAKAGTQRSKHRSPQAPQQPVSLLGKAALSQAELLGRRPLAPYLLWGLF